MRHRITHRGFFRSSITTRARWKKPGLYDSSADETLRLQMAVDAEEAERAGKGEEAEDAEDAEERRRLRRLRG